MRLASNLFHVGILGIFFGHAFGMLLPHSWFLALGISDVNQFCRAHGGIQTLLGVYCGDFSVWFCGLPPFGPALYKNVG